MNLPRILEEGGISRGLARISNHHLGVSDRPVKES